MRAEGALAALARTVDPADPWSHPDAAALDAISFGGWLRATGARPAVVRLHELGALSLAGGSIERQSLLGVLRMVAVAGGEEAYGYERWEGLRLADGSAALAARARRRARRRAAAVRRGRLGGVRRAGRRAGAARRRGGAVGRGGGLRAAGRAAARRHRDGRVGGAAGEPPSSAPGPGGQGRGGLPAPDLARRRPQRALRRRGRARLHLAPGQRRALHAGPARAPRRLPGDAAGRAARHHPRPPRRPVRRTRPASRTRCSPAPGAWTRSPRATSPSGRRGTSWRSGRCTGRTSRRSSSRGRITGWRATWRARCGRGGRRPRRCWRPGRAPPGPPVGGARVGAAGRGRVRRGVAEGRAGRSPGAPGVVPLPLPLPLPSPSLAGALPNSGRSGRRRSGASPPAEAGRGDAAPAALNGAGREAGGGQSSPAVACGGAPAARSRRSVWSGSRHRLLPGHPEDALAVVLQQRLALRVVLAGDAVVVPGGAVGLDARAAVPASGSPARSAGPRARAGR